MPSERVQPQMERLLDEAEAASTRLQLAELLLGHYRAERAEAIEHLGFAICECRDMMVPPSLEWTLRRR